jgi:competence protein ComEC
MATGWVVAMAAAAVVGAGVAVPVPLPVGAGLGIAAMVMRAPLLLVVAVGLLGAGLSSRAIAGLEPIGAGPMSGTVHLVTDPEPVGPGGWRAIVRLPDGARVRAIAYGQAGRALARAAGGNGITMQGRLRPLPVRSAWTDSQHLVGVLDVDVASSPSPGGPLARTAQAVRSQVEAGGSRVPRDLEALYLGLVIGDDRFQPESQQAAFRSAGLSHLLAVSGQNVAFVLLVAGPLLRRLPTWPRFVAVGLVLLVFATVTRFEPSVLRATVTAGLAAWSVALGRPNRGVRVLALAVTALVLVDPLLVSSLGFRLSVMASAGILLLGPRLERALPGPAWVREPLAVTLSAQVAVLPLLASTFGPVSLAAVPANLLAAAPAGLVMTWGLTVGVVAGHLPDSLAHVVQLPPTWALAWIDSVARVAATAPAPRVGSWAVVPLLAGTTWAAWAPRHRRFGVVVLGVALVASVLAPRDQPELVGARWCGGGGPGVDVLVLEDTRSVPVLLEAILDRGMRSIDVLVATGGSRTWAEAVRSIADVTVVGVVLGPAQHQIPDARRVTAAVGLPVAHGTLSVEPAGPDRLEVAANC